MRHKFGHVTPIITWERNLGSPSEYWYLNDAAASQKVTDADGGPLRVEIHNLSSARTSILKLCTVHVRKKTQRERPR